MRFWPAAGEILGYLKARKHKKQVFFGPPQANIFDRFLIIRIPPPLLGTKNFKGGILIWNNPDVLELTHLLIGVGFLERLEQKHQQKHSWKQNIPKS